MTEESKRLREERAKLAQQMCSMVDEAKKGNRGFSDKERSKYESVRARLESHDQRIADQEEAEALKRSIAVPSNPLPSETREYELDDFGNPLKPVRHSRQKQMREHDPLTSEQRMEDWCGQYTSSPDVGQLSLGDCVRSWITGESSEQVARAMSTTGTGGVLIPTPLSARVIDLARNKSRVLQAGAVTWPMTAKTLTVPRQTGDPVAKWRPELGAINRTDATFEPIVLKACSLGALITLSVELIEDSVGLDAFLSTVLSNVMSEGVDQAALAGTGLTDGEDGERIEPIGILNTPNVQELKLNANLSNYQPFSQAVTMVHKVNGSPNAAILSPANMGILDAMTATDGQPLMPPPSWVKMQQLDTNQVGDDVAIIGDWTQVAVGIRHQIRLEHATTGHINGQDSEQELNLFGQNAIALRVLWRGDVAVQRPDQFVKVTGIGGSVSSAAAKPKVA